MYRHCIFCKKPLGANEVIESFPVGRRLAFDPAKGRLWVVCRKCERWNLTPVEERWEAVEECERIFRETRLRVSTENIGLARHPEGMELVRVGKPMRPEFAAWRYGDQFGRRRRKTVARVAAGATVVGAATVGGIAAVTVAGVAVLSAATPPAQIWSHWFQRRHVARLTTDEGERVNVRGQDLGTVRLSRAANGEGLHLQFERVQPLKGGRIYDFQGDEARRLAGAIVPALNRMGGKRKTVREAVERIEAVGHPEAFLAEVAPRSYEWQWRGGKRKMVIHGGEVWKMPHPTRLALEMALHEEQERRALEGELWLLERAWREAEEMAAIADDLLLPEGTEEFVRKGRPADKRDPDS